ncbi:MAG: hypothetical protein H6Q35_2056 [Proteobacteria bacterium]|nr:hypothetical protein [Pseudomonadota bacterium]
MIISTSEAKQELEQRALQATKKHTAFFKRSRNVTKSLPHQRQALAHSAT